MGTEPLRVSFEFFPPGDEAAATQLWQSIQRLAPLQPQFVSVTYGADGSTRNRTHRCVARLLRETSLVVAPHLTCIGATKAEIGGQAQEYWAQGIRHVVALRGDPPGAAASGIGSYVPTAEGYGYASDLTRDLAQSTDLEISVAAYPEGHPEAPGVEVDVANLKRKIEAGARRAITQFFFDTDAYLRYRDLCASAGILAPIVPGILPITRFPQLLRFAARCGANIPPWLHRRFEGLEEDAETRRMIAANVAIEQMERLRAHGVNEFHFYTLNRAELTYAICHALGLRPAPAEPALRTHSALSA